VFLNTKAKPSKETKEQMGFLTALFAYPYGMIESFLWFFLLQKVIILNMSHSSMTSILISPFVRHLAKTIRMFRVSHGKNCEVGICHCHFMCQTLFLYSFYPFTKCTAIKLTYIHATSLDL